MKRFLLFTTLSAVLCFFTACSNDDEDTSWLYGDEQELINTEWYSIPIRLFGGADKYILTFGVNDFTMTKTDLVYNPTTEEIKEEITTFKGTYEYQHPTVLLKLESGASGTWEGTFSALSRIIIKDGGLKGYDFKKQ